MVNNHPVITGYADGETGTREMDSIVRRNHSLVMRPHPENFHRLDVFHDLINKTVLDVDPSGIGAPEFSYQFLIGR